MHAKRFFYVAAGILLLAVAYSIGAHQAGAQSGGQFAGITVDPQNSATTAITTNGDVYARGDNPFCDGQQMQWGGNAGSCGWTYMGNVLSSTVGEQGKSVSDVKSTYRK